MSEQKRCTKYDPGHKVAQAAQTLLAEKNASENKKLPYGRTKRFLVDEELISNVKNTDDLKGEEKRVYTYVSSIVSGKHSVAKPCSTNRKLMLQRTRRRGKSNMKEFVDAPGGDDGGWS